VPGTLPSSIFFLAHLDRTATRRRRLHDGDPLQ
jgi:hypothetical protein